VPAEPLEGGKNGVFACPVPSRFPELESPSSERVANCSWTTTPQPQRIINFKRVLCHVLVGLVKGVRSHGNIRGDRLVLIVDLLDARIRDPLGWSRDSWLFVRAESTSGVEWKGLERLALGYRQEDLNGGLLERGSRHPGHHADEEANEEKVKQGRHRPARRALKPRRPRPTSGPLRDSPHARSTLNQTMP
jgi:hypothetical protein